MMRCLWGSRQGQGRQPVLPQRELMSFYTSAGGVSKSVASGVQYPVQSIQRQTVAGSGELSRGRRRHPLNLGKGSVWLSLGFGQVCGFGTTGCREIAALLTAHRSWAGRHPLLAS